MSKLLIMVLILGTSLSAVADFRIWRDKNGNSIEAELLTMNATQVSIRDRNGKVFKFATRKLCEADQKYLKTAFPPEMEIEFKKKQDRKQNGYSAHVSTTSEITITKKEQRAYDKSLKVVFLIICESQRINDYAILDRVEATFDFKNSREFTLRGNTFSMYENKYDNSVGYKYEGYVAVIKDDQGKVLEVKSSSNEFKEKYALLLDFEAKTRFSKDYRKSSEQVIYMTDGSYYY